MQQGAAPHARTVITLEGDVQVIIPNAVSVPQAAATMAPEPLAYSLDEASAVAGISYNKLLEYIGTGELVSRKNGRHHLILRTELIDFLNHLPTALDAAP